MATTLAAVPGYDEIVDRNDIATLKAPGDLVVRNGDIALSKRGDLLLNDDDYHALFRLVQIWRFNLPTIKVLFDSAIEAADKKQAAEVSLEGCFSAPTAGSPHPLFSIDYGAFHEANDRASANEVARGVYAGAIMIFLSKALQAFRADIEAKDAEWSVAGDQWAGCSVGQIVAASANNVRHNDEWATTNPPSKTQLPSLQVLSAVLGEPLPTNGRPHKLAREVSPETLRLISNGSFEGLEKSVFGFAKALLHLRQQRRATA